MINKLYEKIIKYLKDNYKNIIFILLFFFIFTTKLPYYVYIPGGIKDINEKVIVEGEYKSDGSFNFSYVTELKGTLPTILLSFLLKNWELIKEDKIILEGEDYEDVNYRNHLYLDTANQNATIIAYEKALKEVTIHDSHEYVVYISDLADTNLSYGDEIISLQDIKIDSETTYSEIVSKYKEGDKLKITIKKDNKLIDKYIVVQELDNVKTTGIYFLSDLDYETNPKITYKFSESESGPSGGLMLALTIYNKLTKEDITKGYKIVGTGMINRLGNVGEVGGINHKIISAVKQKADIFFVPSGDNYIEAKKVKEKYKYDIKIIGIETFDDALRYLESL